VIQSQSLVAAFSSRHVNRNRDENPAHRVSRSRWS